MRVHHDTTHLGHPPRTTPLDEGRIRGSDEPGPGENRVRGRIFASERERLTVLAMLLENLGIDRVVQFGSLEDWKAAIVERESQQP
jgi:hypothetical protein